MSTDVLEQSDTRNTDKSPDIFHYVDKNDMMESIVLGSVATALCGEKFYVTKAPKGSVTICPNCKEILEHMFA